MIERPDLAQHQKKGSHLPHPKTEQPRGKSVLCGAETRLRNWGGWFPQAGKVVSQAQSEEPKTSEPGRQTEGCERVSVQYSAYLEEPTNRLRNYSCFPGGGTKQESDLMGDE